MKRITFYKVTLAISAVGALLAIFMLAAWKLGGALFSDSLWIRVYPASMMLVVTESMSRVGTAIVIGISVLTNAALYWIAGSILCSIVVALKGGLRD